MDPLTHLVVGRAVVAAARDETNDRAVGAAAMLGALSPDVDSVLAFSGWDRYVRAHQYGTHSFIGALIMAALAAAVAKRSAEAFALRRTHERRANANDRSAKASAERSPARSAAAFPTVFAAAAAGALSHVLLDLIAGARIAVAWPIAERRVSLPLVAMFDPWFIGICTGWLLMLWPVRVTLQRASRALVAALVAFACLKGVLLGVAIRRSGIAPDAPSAIEAQWASLTDWFVFERSRDLVRSSAISSRGGPPVVLMTHAIVPDTGFVRASRALDDVRNFLSVHDFAFPDETHDAAGRVSVLWSDIRYCWPAEAGARWGPATHCGVHVGGLFDAAGTPIVQVLRIGTFVLRRPP